MPSLKSAQTNMSSGRDTEIACMLTALLSAIELPKVQ